VVLPEPPAVDSDAEEDEAEEDVDGDNNDILAELPDDTEVRFFTPLSAPSDRYVLTGNRTRTHSTDLLGEPAPQSLRCSPSKTLSSGELPFTSGYSYLPALDPA
jgi:hypothetical protein